MKTLLLICLLILSITLIDAYSKDKKVKIDVMYFHTTVRCEGCLKIEEHTFNSIKDVFEKELKDSTITVKSIDFWEEGNEHFEKAYKFDTQTLILSKKVNGKEVKWKNLDKIFEYAGNYLHFQKYLKKEIDIFLKKK